jgi:hypothetical protein
MRFCFKKQNKQNFSINRSEGMVKNGGGLIINEKPTARHLLLASPPLPDEDEE